VTSLAKKYPLASCAVTETELPNTTDEGETLTVIGLVCATAAVPVRVRSTSPVRSPAARDAVDAEECGC
jgi:hypothetical protein